MSSSPLESPSPPKAAGTVSFTHSDVHGFEQKRQLGAEEIRRLAAKQEERNAKYPEKRLAHCLKAKSKKTGRRRKAKKAKQPPVQPAPTAEHTRMLETLTKEHEAHAKRWSQNDPSTFHGDRYTKAATQRRLQERADTRNS